MKNLLIGLFMIVACTLIVGIVLFLQPSVGDGKAILIVRFSNINGLSLGTRVMFAGKPVGEVVAIEQIKNARDQPTNDLGQVYFYQLILQVDSSVQVYNTDEINVQTSGLLGEKSIAIVPRPPPKGIQPSLVTVNTPLYAESIDPLETAFNEFVNLSDKVGETLERVLNWIDQNGQGVGSAIQMFSQTMKTAKEMLDQINQEEVFRHLGVTMKSASHASSALEHVMDSIVRKEGSIGKFLLSEDTYLQVSAILSKLDAMMNDVNQYGFLFHLNKKWQRARLKQAALLRELNTRQNFRAYFHQEVERMNTAISHLSMLIDAAEKQGAQQKPFDREAFEKNLLELMQRLQALYNTLKLYNKQPARHKTASE